MKSKTLLAAMAVAAISVSALGDKGAMETYASRSVYQAQVGVKVGGFWGEKYKLLICKWIPHCIRQMEKGGEYDVEVHAPGGGVLASFTATFKPGGNEIVFDRTAPCRIDDVVLARKK